MDFNKIKIDNSRAIKDYFDYFANNILDINTAMRSINDGGFAKFGEIEYGFSKEISIEWGIFLTSILKKTDLINYISLKTIDEKMKFIFEQYLIDKSIDISKKFNESILELKKFIHKVNYFYYVVNGLICDTKYSFENITIGTFEYKSNSNDISFFEKIKKNLADIKKYKKLKNTYNSNDIFLKEIKKVIKKYKNKVVIEVSNYGDPLIAQDKSKRDAEEFIDQLIFISDISLVYKFDIRIDDYINNEKIQPLHLDYENLSTSALNDELIYSVFFDFLKEDELKNIAFKFKNLCFPLLTTQYDNDLLKKLRTAIKWYSASIKSKNNNESFLFCAIGMESLFTFGRDSITKTLSENTAFLIAKKDIESRKHIYSTVSYLYSQRSGIAHGGNTNIEIKDLNQIRYYLALSITKIINKIINDEINTDKDLFNFFENQKFS